MAETNYQILKEMTQSIIDYLEEQKSIYEDALRAYDPMPIQDSDAELRRIREKEAIVLRDRVTELKGHISVIKLMLPKK